MTAPTSNDLGAVVVDPRFRARRIAVRKDEGRRRLRRLLILIAVAIASLAAVTVLRSPILDVDDVIVQGAVHTEVESIRSATAIDVGEPLLLADLDTAAASIEQLPWVLHASVRRDLPGSVIVDIVEREAVAVVSGGGTAVLVDRDGRVLGDAPPPAFPPYVHVLAPEAPPGAGASVAEELAVAVEIAARLRLNPPGVVAAVRSAPTLRLQLVEGGMVEFGDASAIDEKLEAFRTLYARVDRTCLARIDLRVPTHPVLTRAATCS